MKAEGCRRVVVNIHYLGSLITDYLATYPFEGMQLVISDESALLLETGGALRKAADLFLPELPVVVHNVDILSDLSFQDLLSQHLNSDSLLTLA
nr:nucleotidyltransferase family protein [Bacteroidales bacterium]